MFCPNCGAKLNEGADMCVKCGKMVNKQPQAVTNQANVAVRPKSGAATASLVLGIIAIIVGVITFLISIGYVVYIEESYNSWLGYLTIEEGEVIGGAIGIIFLPALLSIIGLILSLVSKVKCSARTTGLVLNIITLVMVIIQFIIMISPIL